MLKLIVYGMGKTARRFQRYLRVDRAEIVGFTSSDIEEGIKKRRRVIRTADIEKSAYDYIIVASSAYKEIERVLVQLGVSKEKIHQVYDKEKYMYDDVIKEITYWNFTCSNHEYEIGNYRIDLGQDHMLPKYQMEYPMYDCFLGVLSRHLQSGNWAVDIGANVGDSVFLLKKHSDIQILAVEPATDYYDLLCKNTSQLADVYIEKYIVAMDEGEYSLIEHNGTAFVQKMEDGIGDEIKTVTMKNLLEEKKVKLEKIQMIKIDTDGFDADCIMSLGTSLNQINAFIYFENYFEGKEGHDKYEKAYDFLNENKYTHFFIFDNYGNFFCEGDVGTVKTINNYLLRGRKGDSAETMKYIDILAVKEELYEESKTAVEEYISRFDTGY